MTAPNRDAIFISHANPEDNALAVWFGSRLIAASYKVWAEALRLRGCQDWPRLLEDELRNIASKALLISTQHGSQKRGDRNETQIACAVGRSISNPECVMPLSFAHFGLSVPGTIGPR